MLPITPLHLPCPTLFQAHSPSPPSYDCYHRDYENPWCLQSMNDIADALKDIQKEVALKGVFPREKVMS
jgi:hypothetical protein